MVASFVERRRAWLKVSATGIGAPSLAVGSRVSGVTMPDKTVLRGFDMALYLGCKFVVDPTQKLADFMGGCSFGVKFRHAHTGGHSVLMIGAADNRRFGNQSKRGKAGARFVNARPLKLYESLCPAQAIVM